VIEYAAQDKQAFTSALEAIQSHLKKLQKKQKNVKMFRKKDHEIFKICDKLSEYDRLEMAGNGKHLEWKVCFGFIQDCKSMNMGELKNYHAQDCTHAQRGLVFSGSRLV